MGVVLQGIYCCGNGNNNDKVIKPGIISSIPVVSSSNQNNGSKLIENGGGVGFSPCKTQYQNAVNFCITNIITIRIKDAVNSNPVKLTLDKKCTFKEAISQYFLAKDDNRFQLLQDEETQKMHDEVQFFLDGNLIDKEYLPLKDLGVKDGDIIEVLDQNNNAITS